MLFNKGCAGQVFANVAGCARGCGRVAAVFPDILSVLATPLNVKESAHCGGDGQEVFLPVLLFGCLDSMPGDEPGLIMVFVG